MASFRLTNERGEPLKMVPVDAVETSSQRVLKRSYTNLEGIVKFDNLPETGWAPKANITRYSGKSGDMSLNGETNIVPMPEATPSEIAQPNVPTVVNPTLPTVQKTASDFTLPYGILRIGRDGILYFWDGAGWKELGPELPDADPGNGELWLDCP